MLHEFRFVKCVLVLVGFGWGDRAVHDLPADTDQSVRVEPHATEPCGGPVCGADDDLHHRARCRLPVLRRCSRESVP
jgi:hypothetical protein